MTLCCAVSLWSMSATCPSSVCHLLGLHHPISMRVAMTAVMGPVTLSHLFFILASLRYVGAYSRVMESCIGGCRRHKLTLACIWSVGIHMGAGRLSFCPALGWQNHRRTSGKANMRPVFHPYIHENLCKIDEKQ